MSDIYLRLCLKIVFELFHVMGGRILFQNKIIEWLIASANKKYRLKPYNKKQGQNKTKLEETINNQSTSKPLP